MSDRQLSLSPLEISAVIALVEADGETYGVPIHARVNELEGHDVSIGAVYAALQRLADKRLVSSWLGESSAERGGRAKKFFRLTADGYSAADEVYRRAISTAAILEPALGGA